MATRISIMAAITDAGGLGKDNDLLIKIPEDFTRMKKLTIGHPIIMGRKTFESIGRPLPGRTNIIITKNEKFKAQNCIVVHSLEEALELAKKHEDSRLSQSVILGSVATPESRMVPGQARMTTSGESEAFIFGGGQIFKEALPMVDRLYLTVIHKNFPADTFFPDYSEFTKVLEKEDKTYQDFSYTFLTLER